MADQKKYVDRKSEGVRTWHEVIGASLAMGIVTTVIVSAALYFINALASYAVFAGLGGILVTLLTFRSEWLSRRDELRERNRHRLRNHKASVRKPKLLSDEPETFSPINNRWSRHSNGSSKQRAKPKPKASAPQSTPVPAATPPPPPGAISWNEDSFLAGLSELSQPGSQVQFGATAAPTHLRDPMADTNFSGELNEHAGRLKTTTESLALNLKIYRLEGEPPEKLENFQRRVTAMETELRDAGAVFRLLHRAWCEPVLERLLLSEHRADPEKTAVAFVQFFANHPEQVSPIAKAFAVAWIYRKGDRKELRRHLTETAFDAAADEFQQFLKRPSRAS